MFNDLHVNPRIIYDHPAYTLGQRGFDAYGNEYQFGRMAGSADLFDSRLVVTIFEDTRFQRTWGADLDPGDRLGVCVVPLKLGTFGWAQIYGTSVVTVQNNCAAHTNLYTSGAGGRLDDSSTNQQRVHNLYSLEAGTSNGDRVPCVMYYPTA